MPSLDDTLAPLESLASKRLHASDAPCTTPTTGQEIGALRIWSMDRSYHDRIAAGVAMGCASLRHHYERNASTVGIIQQTATLFEWGAALRLVESGADVSITRIEDVAPQVSAAIRSDEQRRGAAASGGKAGRKIDPAEVHTLHDKLTADGRAKHEIAGLIARRLGVSARRVRDILKEKQK